MYLKAKVVARYANGKAPFVGIPIVGPHYRVTAVFRRSHLQAAMEIQPTRIIYNADTHTLNLRNGKSSYSLYDLVGQKKIQLWVSKGELARWARGRRSGAKARTERNSLGPELFRVRQLRETIARLRKERSRIYTTTPHNPVLARTNENRVPEEWERSECRRGERERESRWRTEKPLRQALGFVAARKMLHGEPGTWKEFYQLVEMILGRPIDSSCQYARVHARKNGPYRDEYLKQLPKYIGMTQRSWWDRRIIDVPSRIESYRRDRADYVVAARSQREIDGLIAEHEKTLADLLSQSGSAPEDSHTSNQLSRTD